MSKIIGTAGHVDHGKTALIKALTGMDTDRLKEEKARGITIELGFAYLTLPNGERCGVIDVPGHEKFVRNMLAGASSVDICLFVVAADEGLMPQSREHLEILTLLGVQRGIVVITKKDVVESDWLEMVTADIVDELSGSFLEGAPVYTVSARTGEGIAQLRECIINAVMSGVDFDKKSNVNANTKDSEASMQNSVLTTKDSDEIKLGTNTIASELNAPFRLHADRVFTKAGFGTVVTGTLVDGRLSVGEEVTLYPTLENAKVRSLQVHSSAVDSAHKGQRVAINVSGIKNEDVEKGCVLAAPNSMKNADILDVRLDIVGSTKRRVLNGSRLHLYVGTAETTCKLVIMNGANGLNSGIVNISENVNNKLNSVAGQKSDAVAQDKISDATNKNTTKTEKNAGKNGLGAGETCYAQLRTDTPLAVRAGDRFVVRFFSPVETVGGGIILDPNPPRRSANDPLAPMLFAQKEKGSFEQRVSCFILDRSKHFPRPVALRINPFLDSPDFDVALNSLQQKKEVFAVRDAVIHKYYLAALAEKCKTILKEFSEQNPMLGGMKKEELRSKLLPKQYQNHFDEILALMVDGGANNKSGSGGGKKAETVAVRLDGNLVSLSSGGASLSEGQKRLLFAVEGELLAAGFSTPSLPELAAKYTREQKTFKQVMGALAAGGTVIILGGQIPIHRDFYQKAVQCVSSFNREFTLAEFRDAIGTSRKYAVALLESFDDKGITKKTGDTRIVK